MAEDRLERIEAKIDALAIDLRKDFSGLQSNVAELRKDMSALQVGQADLREGVSALHVGQADVREGVSALQVSQADLRNDVSALQVGQADLRRHMGVLHEEVLDRIKALGEDDSLKIEMRRGFDEVLRSLADHAISGEETDRYFARKIKEHDRRLDALEKRQD